MVRVHKMIVAVTLAEKEERKRDHTIQKALLGFDPPSSGSKQTRKFGMEATLKSNARKLKP